jgi:WD40 repeat protein
MNVGEIRKMSGEQGEVLGVAFLPDGVHALSAGSNGTIILWEVENGLEIRRFLHCQSLATCVAPSPNGTLMLSGGWDGFIRLWNISTGREIMNIRAYSSDQGVSSVAFSADGRFALSGYDHPMRLRPSAGMMAFTVAVESMPMGPSMDETVRLWDLQSGSEVRKWKV